jgi:pyruvate ferredoxin oxidoreductase delta subunit
MDIVQGDYMYKKNWGKLPPATFNADPASKGAKTGNWRAIRPVVDESACIKCGLCVTYCPDGCVELNEKVEFDLDYCKGCGICAEECPKEAISMEKEA